MTTLLPRRIRSLASQTFLRIQLPLALVMLIILGGGIAAYQQAVTSLVLSRDEQLAQLSAQRVGQLMDEDALMLQAIADISRDEIDPFQLERVILNVPPDVLQVFSGGVTVANRLGVVLVSTPSGRHPLGKDISDESFFQQIRSGSPRAISDVLRDAETGQTMISVAVPLLDSQGAWLGLLIGSIHTEDSGLSSAIRRLKVGDEGFAYLVDQKGRVIAHPDPQMVGLDFSTRPPVMRAIEGSSGALLGSGPEGQSLVQGYAPVSGAGWGIVVRESWTDVVAPIRIFSLIAAGLALLTLVLSLALLAGGLRQISRPISAMAASIPTVSAGNAISPLPMSGIEEVDQLSLAFSRMSSDIAVYRAGLRRYLGAVTQSQEDERRRVARDLHDQVIQDLIALSRNLELLQADDARPREDLAQLQAMIRGTIEETRRIIRDLRPAALEDLGLMTAIEGLVMRAGEQQAGELRLLLDVQGQPRPLAAALEVAIYRIIQEALSNIQLHSGAHEAKLGLNFTGAVLTIEVSDDGHGFQVPDSVNRLAQLGNFGLLGIQERVWGVGGTLGIASAPGTGTRLTISIPLPPSPQDQAPAAPAQA
jgi:signal transduction histidine kinase